MRTKAICCSGGMDSYLAWYLCARDGINVFTRISSRCEKKELDALYLIAGYFGPEVYRYTICKGPSLQMFEHEPSGIIPFRNAHLILMTAQYGDDVVLGVLADEINSDKSPEFFRSMEVMMDISHRPQYWTEGRTFTVTTPLRDFNKSQLLEAYIMQAGPMQPLMDTVSCYSDTTLHCGQCASCFKRWVALRNNRLEQEFLKDPLDYFHQHIERKCHDGTYTEARAAEILSAVKA